MASANQIEKQDAGIVPTPKSVMKVAAYETAGKMKARS